MNAPFQVAQATTAPGSTSVSARTIKLSKPQGSQAITVHLDGATKLDLGDIANEKLTFVHVGDRLVILFDNQSTVTIEPFFNSAGSPTDDVSIALAPDHVVTGGEFAGLFPISTDQSILPAAGNGGSPTSGANFSDPAVDPLGGQTPLDLLGNTDTANGVPGGPTPASASAPVIGAPTTGLTDEEGLVGLSDGGPGDVAGTATSVTGSLDIDYGLNLPVTLSFSVSQPSLLGLASGGTPVLFTVATINGEPAIIGYFQGTSSADPVNWVYTVTLDIADRGTYTFTLLHPLDHPIAGTEDSFNLAINFSVMDRLGQTDSGAFTVIVNDDSPETSAIATHDVIDPVTGALPASVSASLGITWGGDNDNKTADGGHTGNGDRYTAFSETAMPGTLAGNGNVSAVGHDGAGLTPFGGELFSNGDVVHFALAGNGTILIAYTGDTVPGLPAGADAEVDPGLVFTVRLADAGDAAGQGGAYTFTQYQQLDHVAGDTDLSSITLTFNFTAGDSDGDTQSGSFAIDIGDTVPTIGTPVAGFVDEDGPEAAPAAGLPGGNPGGEGDDASSTTTTTGSLAINWGADNGDAPDTGGVQDGAGTPGGLTGRAVYFTDADVTIAGVDLPLTSHGEQVLFRLDEDGTRLVGYVPGQAEQETAERIVLVVSLSDDGNGSYTFELRDTLDHLGQGEQVAAAEDDIALTFNFTGRDFDGDTVDGHFTVTVNDDTPVGHDITNESRTDDEGKGDFASSSNEGALVGTDVAGSPAALSGDAGALFSIGADGFKSLVFTAPVGLASVYKDTLGTEADGDPADGFAATEDLVYATSADGSGNTILTATGASTGEVVFTLTVHADGSYEFDQVRPLVHAGAGEDDITFTIGFTVTDGDGDHAGGSLTITVNDDTPVAHEVRAAAVLDDEAQTLFTANPGGDGDVAPDVANVSGVAGALFTAGADGVKSVAFVPPEGLKAIFQNEDGTAYQRPLSYATTTGENGDTILTATATESEDVVFVLTVHSNGSYDFVLSHPLVHSSLGASEENNDIVIGFTVTDGDGDTAAGSLTIGVNDDTPVAHAIRAGTVLDDEAQTLFTANPGGDGDVTPDVATVSGVAGALFTAGADGFKSVAFDSPEGLKAIFQNEDGTASQRTLSYATTTGENGDTILTATATESEDVVFVLTVHRDGSYDFVLSHPLVHDTPGATEETNDIVIGFTVTDGDGDTAAGSLTIGVNDDKPEQTEARVRGRVDENDLNNYHPVAHALGWPIEGSHGTSPDHDTAWNGSTATHGSLTSLVAFGADGQAGGGGFSFAYDNDEAASAAIAALGLDSKGAAIDHARLVGDWLLAGTDDRIVFALKLESDGDYRFVLFDQLDHPHGDNPETDAPEAFRDNIRIDFSSFIKATDGDGDSIIVDDHSFVISVRDDVPVVVGHEHGTAAENDLADFNPVYPLLFSFWQGSLGTSPYDGHTDDSSNTGLLGTVPVWGTLADNIKGGADERGHFHLVSEHYAETLLATLGPDGGALYSHGDKVDDARYVHIDGIGDVMGFFADDGRLVFGLYVGDNGLYNFRLFDQIDHRVGNELLDSVDLDLSRFVTFTDFDGDSVDLGTNTFVITVTDDSPVVVGHETGTVNENDLADFNPLYPGVFDFWQGSLGTSPYDGNTDDSSTGLLGTVPVWGTLADNIKGGADEFGKFNLVSEQTADTLVGALGPDGYLQSKGKDIDDARMIHIDGIGDVMGFFASDGRLVFGLYMSEVGVYNFRLFDQIDHPVGDDPTTLAPEAVADSLGIDLSHFVTYTDYDGDTVDMGTGTFVITVTDDIPKVIGSLSVTLHEDDLNDFNITWVSENFHLLPWQGSIGTSPGSSTDALIGTTSQQGLLDELIGNNVVAGGADEFGKFGLVSDARAEELLQAMISAETAWSSKGQVIDHVEIITIDNIGSVMGFFAHDGRLVFSLGVSEIGAYDLRLFDQLDHSYGDSVQGTLSLDLSKFVTFTDFDGDAIDLGTGNLVLDVVDDVPVLSGAAVTGTVEEEQFALVGDMWHGNEDGTGPGDGDAPANLNLATSNVFIGSLASLIKGGADDNGTFSFDSTIVGQAVKNAAGQALSSHGVALVYAIVNGTLVGFADSDNDHVFDSGERTVFKLSLADINPLDTVNNDLFTFTLLDQVDHVDPAGTATEDIQAIDLSAAIKYTDADGDTIGLGANSLQIDVIDDTPVQRSSVTVTGTVEEEQLAGGNEDGSSAAPDIDNDVIVGGVRILDLTTATATGDLRSLVSVGADEVSTDTVLGVPVAVRGTFALATNTGGLAALTTDHQAISYAVASSGGTSTLTAYVDLDHNHQFGAGDLKVFTLTLTGGGDYTFTLFAPIDHSSVAGQNIENVANLDFSSIVRFSDYDGDTIGLTSGSFTINVIDDTPVAAGVSVNNTDTDSSNSVQNTTLMLDETAGVQSGAADADAPSDKTLEHDVGSLPAVFAGISALSAAGSGIAFASRADALTITPHYGADQPGGATTIRLTDASQHDFNGVATNLQDTQSGQTIYLFTDAASGIVIGRAGANATAAANGPIVFAVGATYDEASGSGVTLSMAEYRGVKHAVPGDRDETATLGDYIRVTVTSTDADGDTIKAVSGALTIRIDDDAPIAVDDTAQTVAEDAADIGGNVLDNDTKGADGATLTQVSFDGGAHWQNVNASGVTALATANGAYTFQADGTWTFNPNLNLNNPAGVGANFTYKITDGDGDTATAVQAIMVTDGVIPSVAGSISLTVSEAAIDLSKGGDDIAAGHVTGNDAGAATETDKASTPLVFTANSDNITGITFGSVAGISVTGADVNATFTWIVNGSGQLEGHLGNSLGPVAIILSIGGSTTAAAGGGTVSPTITATLTDAFPHAAGIGDIAVSGIKVVATDTDGDTATGYVSVTVHDDAPTFTAANVADGKVDEDGLSGNPGAPDPYGASDIDGESTTFSGAMGVSWGADSSNSGLFDRSLAFRGIGEGNLVRDTGNAVVKSHGQVVHYHLTEIGGLPAIVGYVGNDPDIAANRVFTVTLDDSSTTGTYNFTLLESLDHPVADSEDDINIKFAFTATDADGDAVAGSFTVLVDDDSPVVGTIADELLVETTANGVSNKFQAATVSDVSLGINWGADDANPTEGAGANDRSVAFAAGLDGQISSATAGGYHIVYSLSADGMTLTAYRIFDGLLNGTDGRHYIAGNGGDYGTSPSNAARVFTVQLSDSGSTGHGAYTFTLLDNLDHPAGGGANDLPLSFAFTATDADGDSVPGSFTVRVTDDLPVRTGDAEIGHISEVAVAAPPHPSTFGNLNIDWNADDRDTRLTFTDTTITDGHGHTLTLASGGVLLDYAVRLAANGIDQELVAYKDGDPLTLDNPVFVVTLNALVNPAFAFTLFQPLDHTGGYGDTLPLTFNVTGYDGDNDPVVTTFTVNIDDAVPHASAVATVAIEEATGGATTGTVDLHASYGADGDSTGASITFAGTAPQAIADQAGHAMAGLTSYGIALTYVVSADGTTLIAYRFDGTNYIGENGLSLGSDIAAAAGAQVFTVSLADAGTGSYSFTLLQPLDHPAPTGTDAYIDLSFAYKVTDFDGDADSGQFTVRVDAAGSIGSIHYDTLTTGVYVNLSDGSAGLLDQIVPRHIATDRLVGGGHVVGIDQMGDITDAYGSSAGDVLIGGSAVNLLSGNGGDDTIYGGGGDDKLFGGSGNDTFIYKVGDGNDAIDGGSETAGGSPNADVLQILGDSGGRSITIAKATIGTDIDPTLSDPTASNATDIVVKAGSGTIRADEIERVEFAGGAGNDTLTINDVTGTALAGGTIAFKGGAGDDTLDLRFLADSANVISDGGANNDTVRFAFGWSDATYAKVFADDGVTLTGVQVTHNGVTDTVINYETFVFQDGTFTLHGVFDKPPVAVDDTATVDEDKTLTVSDPAQGVLHNDTDPDAGDTLSVVAGDFVTAHGGAIHFNADGTYVYTAAADFNGLDSVDYTVRDVDGRADTGTLTITVNPVDDAPVNTVPDTLTTLEDTPYVFTGSNAPKVADIDSDLLSVTLTAANGSLSLSTIAGLTFTAGDGSGDATMTFSGTQAAINAALEGMSLTPDKDFNGDATVMIETNDGSLTDTETFTVTVTPVNDLPVTYNDSGGMSEDASAQTFDVLANDVRDPDANAANNITVSTVRVSGLAGTDYSTLLDPTTSGLFDITVTPDNQIRVELVASAWDKLANGATAHIFVGYTLHGDGADTSYSELDVLVTGANDAPVLLTAPSPAFSVLEDAPVPVGNVGAAVSSLLNPVGGSVGNVADPDAISTLPPGMVVTAFDSGHGVLYWSSDNGAHWTPVNSLASGQALYLLPTDQVYFKPAADYNGTLDQAITFHAWDRSGGSFDGVSSAPSVYGGTSPYSAATDTVSVTVTPVNDAPVVTSNGGGATAAIAIVENTTAVTTVASTDIDGGTPAYSIVQTAGTDFAKFQIDAVSGALSFVAAPDFENAADIGGIAGDNIYVVDVKVSDGNGGTDTQRISVTVTDVGENTAPVSQIDSYMTNEDVPLVIDSTAGVLANDSDADHNALAAILVGNVGHGTLVLNANGSFTYTPDANYNGTDSFTYKANDGTVDGNTVTVSITVSPVNDAPTPANNSVAVTEDATASAPTRAAGVLGNDTDPDSGNAAGLVVSAVLAGSVGTASAVAAGAATTVHGTYGDLAINADGTYTYTPNNAAAEALPLGQHDSDVFTYTAKDTSGATATATLTFDVTGANDVPQAVADGSGDTAAAWRMTEDEGSKTFDVRANDVRDVDSTAQNHITIVNYDIGGYANIDKNDLQVEVVNDQIKVTLLGSDWNALGTSGYLNATITYALHGDQPSDSSAAQLTVRIDGVNDAPTLLTSASPSITTIEDAPAPSGAVGTLVSSLVDRVIDGNGLDNFVDPDSSLAGVAIVGANSAHGTWYYSINGGTTWSSVGTVSETQALVLRPENLLYFKPDADWSGTVSDGLTFHAWDVTSTPGSNINVTAAGTGGTAPFSTATDTVAVTVNAINHAPTAVADLFSAPLPPTGNDWHEYNGHYYKIVDADATWSQAAVNATAAGGYLITIGSQGEQDFVSQYMTAGEYYWAGGSDSGTEGTWTWMAGPEADTTFWTTDWTGYVFGIGTVSTGTAYGFVSWPVANGHYYWEPNNGAFGSHNEDYLEFSSDGWWNDADNTPGSDGGSYIIEWGGNASAPTEDTAFVLSAASLTANDTDPEHDALTVTGVSSASHGIVQLVNGVITFTPDANYNGEAGFDYTISDGHSNTSSAHVTIEIAAVNDAPSGADKTISMVEDVSYTFTQADFGFTDSADGDHFKSVIISSLPDSADGRLLYGNALVTQGQEISVADIDSGMLSYAPKDDVIGNSGDGSFKFQVVDDGATGGANVNTDPSANTMTLDLSTTDYDNNATSSSTTTYQLSATATAVHVSLSDSGGTDTVVINTAANGATSFTDLEFLHSDNNMEISWSAGGSSRTLTLLNEFSSGNSRIENFQFDDGGSYDGDSLGSGVYTLLNGLTGSSGDEIIAGSNAIESLSGGGGNDLLFGNGGDDTLTGGSGHDLLIGGLGKDTFVFSSTGDSGTTAATADVIGDFVHGQDTIDLSAIDAKTQSGNSGNQAFVWGGQNASTLANSVTWHESNGNTFVHMDTGGDTSPEMMFILTGVNLGLTQSDFKL